MGELATAATKILVGRARRPIARARGVAYLHFERPDLERAARFLNDFGLIQVQRSERRLYLRGVGSAPYLVAIEKSRSPRLAGFGLLVSKRADLEALAALPGASAVEPVDDPGGGERVRLRDPSGIRVDALWGREELEPLPVRAPLEANVPGNAVRVNAGQRPALLPPAIHKLGHVVLETVAFRKTLRWYLDTFGLIATDVLCLPDGSPALGFLRCDLEEKPADHHSVVISAGLEVGLNHCAFEVTDLDAVAMGQQVMKAGGWEHAWGVGRHLLGSQIFDYWSDPWGEKFEHYADGDVFEASHPTGFHPLDRSGLYQWGPDIPPSFVLPKLTPERAASIVRNVTEKNELTFKRLRQLQRAMASPVRPWQR